jgi:hypothetical protein
LRGKQIVAQLIFQLLQALLTAACGNDFVSIFDKTTCDTLTKTRCCPGNKIIILLFLNALCLYYAHAALIWQ